MPRYLALRLALMVGLMVLFLVGVCSGLLWLTRLLPAVSPGGPGGGWPVAAGLAAGLVLTVGFLVTGLRRLASPVEDLIEAAGRVEAGDYDVSVLERGPRELRSLARSFNAMAERLRFQDDQRRALLAEVTHELRTPMTIIQGNLEGLADGVYPADAEHLAPVLDEIRQLSRRLDDLKTLSEAEAGGLRLLREATDLGVLIEDAAAAFRTAAERDGVQLLVDVPGDFPLVDVDPGRLKEVLVNLIANALRYSPPQGVVRIAARSSADQHLEISVSDQGRGISDEDLPHIFERFRKSADSPGSGLGLAIARRLVEAHGGTLTARSRLGHGTTQTLDIPARD